MEGGFEHSSFCMGEGKADLAQAFIHTALTGYAEQIRRTVRVLVRVEFEGAVGFFRLMEEFCLRLATLEGGENGPEIAESPLHGDFVFPIELLFAHLRGRIDENGSL